MTFLSDPASGRLNELIFWSRFFPLSAQAYYAREITSSLILSQNCVNKEEEKRRKRTEKFEEVNELALAQGDTKNIMSRSVNILEDTT